MSIGGFLVKEKRNNIGNLNAIRISDDDIVGLRMKKIQNLEDITRIWSIKYSTFLTIGLNTITSSIIYKFYLRKFKGRLSWRYTLPIIPSIIIPSIAGAYFSNVYFIEKLLIQSKNKINECMVCHELRANLTNTMFGTFVPAAASWSGLLITTYVLQLINPPEISLKILKQKEERKKIFTYYTKIFKKTNTGFGFTFSLIVACQLVVMSVLYYVMQEQFFDVEDELKLSDDDIHHIMDLYGDKKNYHKS